MIQQGYPGPPRFIQEPWRSKVDLRPKIRPPKLPRKITQNHKTKYLERLGAGDLVFSIWRKQAGVLL